jgi:predicted esterase
MIRAHADPHATTRTLRDGPVPAEAQWALIVLHGRGADAPDALALGRAVAPAGASILAPEAAGNTWYPLRFLAPLADNEPDLSSALRRIDRMVDTLREQGVPRQRTLLAGFSQGACLGSEFILRSPDAVAAAALFTGGIPGTTEEARRHGAKLPATKVYLATGEPDPHIPLERVELTRDLLVSLGATVRFEVFRGRPHTVSAAEVEGARSTFAQLTGELDATD